jgi:hypothetical protein
MNRVPTVVVKSPLAGSVAAGVVAIAALALSPQPATAQAPTITVSATIPVEVSDPTDLSAAAAFAWSEFIALTWPALPQGDKGPDGKPVFPRGQPDTSLKYGDPGKTGQVVWETFRHKSEAFPGQGNPNGYDPSKPDFGFGAQPDYVYQSGRIPPLNPNWNPPFPPFHNLDEVTQIGLDGMYAGAVDPSTGPASSSTNVKEKILFEAKVNEAVYQYVAQPRKNPAGKSYSYFQSENPIVNTIKTNSVMYLQSGDKNKYPGPYINLLPSDPKAGKAGSIEIKASFRRLNPTEDKTKYYTAPVRYYQGDSTGKITGYVDSNDPTFKFDGKPEVWGLTSLHIIQKTPNAPTFVFATFGHINNILDAAGNPVEEPNGKTMSQYKDIPPFQPALTITASTNGMPQMATVAGTGPPVNTNTNQLYFYNFIGDLFKSYNGPININRRLWPIPPTIQAANDAAFAAIRTVNDKAVWLNYRLINVQARPLDVRTIPAGEEPTFYLSNEVVETNPALQQFSGRVDNNPKSKEPTNFVGTDPTNYFSNAYVVQQDGSIKGYTMGGCMGCHGTVGQNQGGDFSVVMATGRVVSPDAVNIDEHNPAVVRALARKYLSKQR